MRTVLVLPQLKFSTNQISVIRSAEAFGVTELCIIGSFNFKTGERANRKAHRHIKKNYFTNSISFWICVILSIKTSAKFWEIFSSPNK